MFKINSKVTFQASLYGSGTIKHNFRLTEKLIIAKADSTPTLNTRDDELFVNADVWANSHYWNISKNNKRNDKRFNNRGYSLFFFMDIFLKHLPLIPNIL